MATFTDANNNTWYIDSYGRIDNIYSSSYSMFDTAAIAAIRVGTTTYDEYLTYGTETSDTNTFQVTGTGYYTPALSLTRSVYIGDGYARYIETISNTGTTSLDIHFSLTDNVYYGSNTAIVSTSSGDTSVTSADQWYVFGSSYNSSAPYGAHIFGDVNDATLTYSDNEVSTYDLTIPAGGSRTIVHYYAVGSDSAALATLAENINTHPDQYLGTLTTEQTSALVDTVNFSFDVTASVTTTLEPYQSNLTLTGTANINGTGNDLDNTILGNSGSNILRGLGGNDILDGRLGADTMIGGTGDDTYFVNVGTDVVTELAGEGNDTVKSTVNYDVSLASRLNIENITLLGTALTAKGNASDNILIGNASNNTLTGLAGNDILDGGAGVDTLVGGLGNDTYYVDNTADIVTELASQGVDTVNASINYSLVGKNNVENLVLTGTAKTGTGNALANRLTGNDQNNTLTGLGGNDIIDGGLGADRLVGGLGNDTYIVDNSNDIIVENAGEGVDTVKASSSYQLGANVENLTLIGTATDGIGNAMANKIIGNSYNNLLDGKAGADRLIGGLGNDTYVIDNVNDVIVENADEGTDTVKTSLNNYTLGAEIENGELLDGATVMNGNAVNNVLIGNADDNTLYGLDGNDTLRGGSGNDTLYGGNGDDILIGDNGGPEVKIASTQATVDNQSVALNISVPESATGTISITGTLSATGIGEAGLNIVYIIDQSGSMSSSFVGSVNVPDQNGDGSSNTIMDAAIASFTALHNSIINSGIGSMANVALIPFSDSAPITYSGYPSTDLNGNGTPDLIDGLRVLYPTNGTNYTAALTTAKDYLASIGSGQNIVFFVSDGQPNDTSYLTSVLPELLALGQGGTIIKAIGTGSGASEETLDILDDMISNDSATIVLDPQTLTTELVRQSLLGVANGAWVEIYKNGVQVDVIGSDEFVVTPLGLQFASDPFDLSTSGTDTITARLVMADNAGTILSVDAPIDIQPFVSNDTLYGGDGNDTLNGGYGADTMVGGLGDDVYFVDNINDVVTENAGEGTDTLSTSIDLGALADNLENLTLLGTVINGTGNAENNIINGNASGNTLYGMEGNDTLNGNDGNDVLDGGDGTNYLYGGNGDDTLYGRAAGATGYVYNYLYGGDGSDTYYVNSSSDYVSDIYTTNSDVDTVIASINYTLGGYVSGVSTQGSASYIENLTLLEGSTATIGIGSSNDNTLLGNANDNSLYGMEGNDILNGGAGADLMDGGSGNDTFWVDNAGDVVVDSAGTDTVISRLAAYTLGDDIENLTLLNVSTVKNGTGNALDNRIVGNDNANIINGGAGQDSMVGGKGNDTYYVDNVMDRIVEKTGEGVDTVISSVGFKLSSNLENLTLSGIANIAGSGNLGNNILKGNAGDNYLIGLAGNDTLVGNGGDDIMNGGVGNDTLYGGAGNDTLTGDLGADFFVFNTALSVTDNVDTITDFNAAADTIHLENAVFKKLLTTGTLAAGNFAANATGTAGDANDFIVYNTSTGELFYDADGNGAGAAIQFAVLGVSSHPTITNADFVVI